MKAAVRQLLGLAVALVSFVGSIIICALSQWRVTKAPGFQVYEGLWKYCVTSSMHFECRTYDSEKVLIAPDLAGARVLIVITIIAEVTGILLGVAASKFVNFVPDERKKSKMAMASGVVFLIAGVLVLISVCWITNKTNAKVVEHVKFELGGSSYIGWITTVLLFLGGGLLCSSFLRRDGTD